MHSKGIVLSLVRNMTKSMFPFLYVGFRGAPVVALHAPGVETDLYCGW